MKIGNLFVLLTLLFAAVLAGAGSAAAQSTMTLTGIGNGEKVRLAAGGKSKIVNLESTEIGDFTAGGDSPHRYATLLSVREGNSYYTIAKFVSGPAISNPNSMCGGDRPMTLLLIKAGKNLLVEDIQTEIFASCIYNGAGRYVKGRPVVTKSKVSISFDEGAKKYILVFDAAEAEKGLQLSER